MGSVFDTWAGSWVFLLPSLKVNIQSSSFEAQYRNFTITSLGGMAVVSVSVAGVSAEVSFSINYLHLEAFV